MARGVDVITCSSGGIAGPINTALVPRTPGYHVAYSDRVRREVGLKTVAVGLITEAHYTEQILSAGQADLIALARELLYNPPWPVHAAKALGIDNYLDILPQHLLLAEAARRSPSTKSEPHQLTIRRLPWRGA